MTRLFPRALLLCALAAAALHTPARAQESARTDGPRHAAAAKAKTAGAAPAAATPAEATSADATPTAAPAPAWAGGGEAQQLDEVLRLLREQRQEIERLRARLDEQTRAVVELRSRVERAEYAAAAASAPTQHGAPAAATQQVASPSPQAASTRPATFAGALYGKDGGDAGAAESGGAAAVVKAGAERGGQEEDRVGRVEGQVKKTADALARQLGSITFSGDLRLRYESFYGQQNALPMSDNPAALGNELSARHRFRLRARLALRGQIGKQIEWGLRLNTGSFADPISTNMTMTDFFTRKPFMLDHAYVAYRPAGLPGLQLQAGKFDVPWLRTEMTVDNDLTVEGASETYTRAFEGSALKSVALVAWQLPFLERNSAFVLGPDGRVDLAQSARNGRDLALYGAQLRARFEPSKTFGLTLSAADLYYSGTQFITPAQFLGPNVQVPVTVTIPATAASPAQTVSGFATIPREQLVSGNANLGAAVASSNATNRDGRLSSGFNLVDLIARLDYTRSERWPVMLLLNYVRNTQARDVVAAGPGGLNRVLENDENQGFWAEFQVGRTQQRGDYLLNYTFVRLEKDAVLTPFNFSDFNLQSDMLAHRLGFAYALDPRVTLSVTGYVSTRPNGLLGPFALTPPGSLNRPTTRLQFDTLFRF